MRLDRRTERRNWFRWIIFWVECLKTAISWITRVDGNLCQYEVRQRTNYSFLYKNEQWTKEVIRVILFHTRRIKRRAHNPSLRLCVLTIKNDPQAVFLSCLSGIVYKWFKNGNRLQALNKCTCERYLLYSHFSCDFKRGGIFDRPEHKRKLLISLFQIFNLIKVSYGLFNLLTKSFTFY